MPIPINKEGTSHMIHAVRDPEAIKLGRALMNRLENVHDELSVISLSVSGHRVSIELQGRIGDRIANVSAYLDLVDIEPEPPVTTQAAAGGGTGILTLPARTPDR
jgi:hypothetical protein